MPRSCCTEVLNFAPMNGKPIRIMYSHRDPNIHKSGAANIFIKGPKNTEAITIDSWSWWYEDSRDSVVLHVQAFAIMPKL
ncbi:unnamed protein product [Victoria cruziana]